MTGSSDWLIREFLLSLQNANHYHLAEGQCDCACASSFSYRSQNHVLSTNGDLESRKDSTVLSSWLHLTEACNLACDYCYLPHYRAEMPAEIGYAAIDATFRSATVYGYPAIKFKYAGGEPLLRFPLIQQLHSYARSLAESRHIVLDGIVLSNGTLLTSDMARTLLALDLRLMISVDGWGASHDCQRHFPDGRGSFSTVIKAVELALEHGLIPTISITVSGRNVDSLTKLLTWVLNHDLPFSLNFYRENNCSASFSDLNLEHQRLIKGMRAAYNVIGANLPSRSTLGSLLDRVNLGNVHIQPCSAGHSYLVFACDGRIAKCQMDLEHTVTDVNDPDPLSRIRNSSCGVQNPSIDEKAECQSCMWRYWCAGGCPLHAHRATQRYDAPSPYCHVYKTLCSEVVRLEAMRLGFDLPC